MHRLSEIDPNTQTAFCAACERRVDAAPKLDKRHGTRYWECRERIRASRRSPKYRARAREHKRLHDRPYLRHRGTECERCGFIPEYWGQLDVHHLNGDHKDNRPENLQTVCANCHRLPHCAPPDVYEW